MNDFPNTVTDAQVKAWMQITESMSADELIRRKWLLESALAAIRQEMQARDARAVDEACALLPPWVRNCPYANCRRCEKEQECPAFRGHEEGSK